MSNDKPVMIRDKAAVSAIRRWQRKTKPKISLGRLAAQMVLEADEARKGTK